MVMKNERATGPHVVYPVASLMCKSGTSHLSMARAIYLARPIAMSSYGDSFPAKSLS